MTEARRRGLNRRQLLAAGLGVAGLAAAGTGLGSSVWPLLAQEDLIPGSAPLLQLTPAAWSTTADSVRIAALGDNGSGGRQAMAVANRLAQTYEQRPFEVVAMLGDICYYGDIENRFDDVFRRPLRPLIDAGVRFELALGNHDTALNPNDAALHRIETELRLLGTPALYYSTTHGPVDLFYLDSSIAGLFGPAAAQQLEWLDDALASATSQWRIVALHHPPYSSGEHGSTPGAAELLEPILRRRAVDLVLSGHDHHYERTYPQGGVTYVVSGGGCKTTAVRPSRFSAVAERTLQCLILDVTGDRLRGTCLRPDGQVVDRFELRAREGR
jgi:3',5'-cyclic AMP phosphodiesterase CpdA